MKKKTVIILSIVLILLVALGVGALIKISNNKVEQMEGKMWEYLADNGYAESEIKSVEVKHSFLNAILSYNEWTVDVVFMDEPTSVYKYTVENGKIVQSGVSGTTNKEDLKH